MYHINLILSSGLKSFHKFVWLIFKGSLYFLLLHLIKRYGWHSGLPWLCFIWPNSLHVLFSSASCAHSSQKGLWSVKGSCSGVNIITRIAN